jgi:hypothetical protein
VQLVTAECTAKETFLAAQGGKQIQLCDIHAENVQQHTSFDLA